jgi:hypothetical protein
MGSSFKVLLRHAADALGDSISRLYRFKILRRAGGVHQRRQH